MELLKNAIADMISISKSEEINFLSMCYQRKFQRKEILSEDNKIIDEVYFIEK